MQRNNKEIAEAGECRADYGLGVFRRIKTSDNRDGHRKQLV